ncbi:site-specific DNA-methyltransferase [Dickeya ananatis]|uniref:DNA-methyltransferase n=1 Tax=Dickeya ananatis TaxID=3061286 RepID=UPI00388E5890
MEKNTKKIIEEYVNGSQMHPLFIHGDAQSILKSIPDESVNCVITSPPYWLQREYENGGIGQEKNKEDYINNLLKIFIQIKRIIKNDGSFWLNINDTYYKKSLSGIPWRIAIAMMDEQGWILRNDVIWNKLKGGMDSSRDRLNNIHENIFHFVKKEKYFYNIDAIRTTSRKSYIKNGTVVSATGVTGVSYKRRIELSTSLTDDEKNLAFAALDDVLLEVASNKISDFRMVIRGQHRITHSDKVNVSGRARELQNKGFYFLKYHPKGSKPSDVWEIPPEDAQKRGAHFAPYPEDICKIPIMATCPKDGVVLDPFVGTGTTTSVAYKLGYRSIGIDLSENYLTIAEQRIDKYIP